MMLQQAWHIFTKDLLYLQREISIFIAVVAVASFGPDFGGLGMSVTEWLVLAAGAYLVGRLIHADALAGDRQFWITRPVRRSSLLVAKLLFIALLIDLPVLVPQWIILARSNFSFGTIWQGLLWEQILWFVSIWLPLAALAALTRGLVPFVSAILGVAVVTIGLTEFVRVPGHRLDPMEWVRSTIAVIALLAASAIVLYLQLRWRNTLRSALTTFSVGSAGIVAYLFLPWTLTFAIQERLSSQTLDPAIPRITLNPKGNKWAFATVKAQQVQMAVALVLQGLPAGDEVKPEVLDVTLHSANGRVSHANIGNLIAPNDSLSQSHEVTVTGNGVMDRKFFEEERDHLVTMRGSLYLTVFGNKESPTISGHWVEQPVLVTSRLQCIATQFGVICDSPLRTPKQLVGILTPGLTTRTPLGYGLSYSPFPASLRFFPLARQWGQPFYVTEGNFRPRTMVPALIMEVLEPIAYIRRDFEIPNVRLTDIALPWHRQNVTRGGKTFVENEY